MHLVRPRSRVWWLPLSLAAALLLTLGVYLLVRHRPSSPPPAADHPYFRDVTATSGVQHTYRNGEEANHLAILESLGGGVALLDYDGDGLLDIFLTGGGYFAGPDHREIKGHPCRLYRNLGGWKFQDVTAEVGLDSIPFYNHGAAVADYDRDGWPDLLVTGYGRLALFHNESNGHGGRHFVEVTRQAGLLGPHFWSTSAAWADLDGDGYPDLYVCQYVDWSLDNDPVCNGYSPGSDRDVCPPREFDARPHALYRNNGNGTFRDVSKEAGLRVHRNPGDYEQLDWLGASGREMLRQVDRDRDYGKGLGVLALDIDGDSRPDLYVSNDTTDNFLYLNRSVPGKIRLEEVGLDLGVARDDRGVPNGSMGVTAADYDGSGVPSLLVTNYENEVHALYHQLRVHDHPAFEFASYSSGIAALGRSYVGFGTGFLDLDNDGWEDLVIVHGHVIRHPARSTVRQRPALFRNPGKTAEKGPLRFSNVTDQGGDYFQTEHVGRGVAIGDLDNDGRADLVISHLNEPVVLLRNEGGEGHHWLGVELVGHENADVTGARVVLEVGGRRLTRFTRGGGSYLSSGDRRLLFGLGDATTVGRLSVVWPGGQEQHWDGLATDRYWRLVAGEEAASPLPNSWPPTRPTP